MIQFQAIPSNQIKVCIRKSRELLSAEEKLNRLMQRLRKKGRKSRRFHFKIIDEGTDKSVLFDGFGKRWFENSNPDYVKRIREIRDFAVMMFLDAPKKERNGGYLIN